MRAFCFHNRRSPFPVLSVAYRAGLCAYSRTGPGGSLYYCTAAPGKLQAQRGGLPCGAKLLPRCWFCWRRWPRSARCCCPAQPDATRTPARRLRPRPGAPAPAQQAPAATPQPDADASAPLTLYDAAAGREIEVAVEEFLLGAAACEMPPDWPDAALCAQMVASHSYALALGEPMQVNSALCAGWTERRGVAGALGRCV